MLRSKLGGVFACGEGCGEGVLRGGVEKGC